MRFITFTASPRRTSPGPVPKEVGYLAPLQGRKVSPLFLAPELTANPGRGVGRISSAGAAGGFGQDRLRWVRNVGTSSEAATVTSSMYVDGFVMPSSVKDATRQ